jgi:hypothetical protein
MFDGDMGLAQFLHHRMGQLRGRGLQAFLHHRDIGGGRLDLRGQHVDLRFIALGLLDDGAGPGARCIDQFLGAPVVAHRNPETVIGRLFDEDLDHVREFLVHRPACPGVLAREHQVLYRLFGEEVGVLGDLGQQVAVEGRFDEPESILVESRTKL